MSDTIEPEVAETVEARGRRDTRRGRTVVVVEEPAPGPVRARARWNVTRSRPRRRHRTGA